MCTLYLPTHRLLLFPYKLPLAVTEPVAWACTPSVLRHLSDDCAEDLCR
jgi:hypothetical protein